jgi:hypothetical protein
VWVRAEQPPLVAMENAPPWAVEVAAPLEIARLFRNRQPVMGKVILPVLMGMYMTAPPRGPDVMLQAAVLERNCEVATRTRPVPKKYSAPPWATAAVAALPATSAELLVNTVWLMDTRPLAAEMHIAPPLEFALADVLLAGKV